MTKKCRPRAVTSSGKWRDRRHLEKLKKNIKKEIPLNIADTREYALPRKYQKQEDENEAKSESSDIESNSKLVRPNRFNKALKFAKERANEKAEKMRAIDERNTIIKQKKDEKREIARLIRRKNRRGQPNMDAMVKVVTRKLFRDGA